MNTCMKCGAALEEGNPRCPECGWMLPLPPGTVASPSASEKVLEQSK